MRRLLLAALIAAALTGCSSEDFVMTDGFVQKLPDGTSVMCVKYTGSGGITCDWGHRK